MRFDDLDNRMRAFETAHDLCVMPELFIVVRLDGRSFTRQTKDVWQFDAPFDTRFRDLMLATTAHLMDCGFSAVYGYTQSDEISLLLRRDDATFNRKLRKIVSVLAGEASARFSLSLGQMACFDARVCQLPTPALVRDYFRWRQEDAHRNALNAHGYWLLRKQGQGATQAAAQMSGLSVAQKNELLFQAGINFNDLPAWQKRGMAVYWAEQPKAGLNPKTGLATVTSRRVLHHDLQLPFGDTYEPFIEGFIAQAQGLTADTAPAD